ncbi:MAG: sterol desaturase family protein [Pseudomonadota bacterium]
MTDPTPLTLFGISEPAIRLGLFAAAFILFSALETLAPRRARLANRWQRWATNGAMLLLATGLVRAIAIAAPFIAGVAAAGLAATLGVGLFHWLELPFWLEVIAAVALLDLAIWFQHLVTHKVPLLWRLHRVHHADRDLDASSALRFHPAEIILSAGYKLAIILLLGPAAIAVLVFEVLLNASALFNHANLALPTWLDRALRTVMVTPDMHRVHHSVRRDEHDTNFGFCLSIWDRAFGTYRAAPDGGHTSMTIGLPGHLDGDSDRLDWSLTFPLHR